MTLTPEPLDLGEIEPGVPAGEPRPTSGAHPWAPSEFARREAEGWPEGYTADQLVAIRNARLWRRLEESTKLDLDRIVARRVEAEERCVQLGVSL